MNNNRTTKYIGIMDSPMIASEGAVISDINFIVQFPSYGRIIFTKALGLDVPAPNVTIRDCSFSGY